MAGGGRRRVVLARAALGVALACTLLALLAVWDEVGPRLARFDPATVLAALGAAAAGTGASVLAWRRLLSGLGSPLPLRAAARVVLVGQLGKYVPGSVWPVLAQAEAAARWAVPRTSAALATLVLLVLSVATGAAVGLALMPGSFPGSTVLAAVAGGLAAALLAPGLLDRVLRLLVRRLGRGTVPARLPAPALAAATAWVLLTWAAYGTATALLAAALGADLPGSLLPATGAFAAAWVAGFLAVVAPAGLGVRDVALVVALLPMLPAADAAAVAVVSRLLTTGSDLLLGLAALRLRQPAGTAPPG